MVSSEKIHSIESYYKNDAGVWELTDSQDLANGSVRLHSVGLELFLRDVYARVENS